MKKLLVIIMMFTFSTVAQSAEKKKSSHSNSPTVVVSENNDQSAASDNNMSIELGFKQSALHFGVAFVKEMDPVDLGGYFFFQTDKKYNDTPRVNQVISFGGLAKFYAMKSAKANAYIAPGFGIHMIKDSMDTVAGSTQKSDKTAVGPLLKIGATLALNPTLNVGLEYTQLANWFDELILDSSFTYTSAVVSFSF